MVISSNILINPKGGIKREMKTLRKIRKNAKALSPVVASIILIAVTVAVSIAVAAWMGALTVGFMATEELKITNVQFTDSGTKQMVITARNTGSGALTISDVYVNNVLVASPTYDPDPPALEANEVLTATFDYAWIEGTAYQVKLQTTKGNTFIFQATGPT